MNGDIKTSFWRELQNDETYQSYGGTLSRVVATAIRHWRSPNPPYPLPITEEFIIAIDAMWASLQSSSVTIGVIHAVFKHLWRNPEASPDVDDMDCFLLSYLTVAAVKDDGNLMRAEEAVSMIAHLKFGAKAFSMMEATHMFEREAMLPHPPYTS